MVDPELLASLDALQPISFATEAFRHVAQDHHPLSGVGARLHGGRWNPPDSFSTLYLAVERETAVGEFYRLATRQGRAPGDFLPRFMYRYDVALSAVADLRDPDVRRRLGLGDRELKANDAVRCRQIGAAAYGLGLEGVIAPSAAVGGTVLAVFFDRLRADSLVRDLEREVWMAPPLAP